MKHHPELKTQNSKLRTGFLPFAFFLLPLILGLLLCAFFIALAGQSPLTAGAALVEAAVGSRTRLAESLSKTIPLMMTGLGVAMAFRAGFFNVGAEGQFLMGALAAAALGTRLALPYPLVLAGGALAGGGWALFSRLAEGAARCARNHHHDHAELHRFANRGVLRPGAIARTRAHHASKRRAGPRLATAGALARHDFARGLDRGIVLRRRVLVASFRTESGFKLRAAGANPIAAQAAGIAVERNVLGAVALAGALAGLGGAMEVAGATKQLGQGGFNYGYTAIAVALLGGSNPLGVVPAALLFGMLSAGGNAMERTANVPAVTVSIVIGIVIFLTALLGKQFNRELR